MALRPLSYEEMCQMEMLHVAGANNSGAASSATATMLPIMVIPTSMIPPGTILTTAPPNTVDGGGGGGVVGGGNLEHFYHLQPTHIFTTASSTAGNAVGCGVGVGGSGGVGGVVDGISLGHSTPTSFLHVQAPPPNNSGEAPPQQHPQQIPLDPNNGASATVNLVYAGTLTKKTPLTRNALESASAAAASAATLPRSFQPSVFIPTAGGNVAGANDESDFEGSECGASVSATTCIPHFRFGGCGIILQPPMSSHNHPPQQQQHQQQHQQQQQQQHDAPPVIGCGSLSHMMGSFAVSHGAGAIQGGGRRLAGTLAGAALGAAAGLSGTLGRNRRSAHGDTQTPKRVSFKGDNLPASSPDAAAEEEASAAAAQEMQLLEESEQSAFRADAFNNCSYMHFDNFMDYQTTGFGGLPDVTEHSNIRRTLSRQNSISNSDSGGEIASIQKSKINFGGVSGISCETKSTTPTSAHHHLHHHHAHHLAHDATLTPNAKRKSKAAHAAQSDSSGANDGAGIVGSGRNKMPTTRRGSCILALMLVAALCLLAIAATLAYQHFLMAPSRNSQAQRLRIVRRILREVPLVDGHNNFAWNVRRYAHSSLELVSHLSHAMNGASGGDNNIHDKYADNDDPYNRGAMWRRPAWAQTDMERLRQGLVGVQVWSAYVPCEAQGLDAVQLALEQIDIIRRFTEMYATQTTLVTSSADMMAAHRRGLMASLIGIEGGHTIGSSLGVLRSFYSLGARYLSLTHKCDVTWAGSAAGGGVGGGVGAASALENNGLTPFGKSIVREMNRLGMMIDLSYSSDATARDVLEVTRAPVIFSHSAARQLCNSTRNIPDEIMRMVADNGGLIMISFDSEDVACGRTSSGGRPAARLADVIEHINYIRDIAGIQHIGLGAGYDGIEVPPIGLEDVSKYPELLATLLEDHYWSEEHIAMLAGRNFLRIMEAVENVREYWKLAAIQPIEQTEPLPKTQCTYMAS